MIENIKLLGNFDIENYFFDELGNWYFAHDLYVFLLCIRKVTLCIKNAENFRLIKFFFQ